MSRATVNGLSINYEVLGDHGPWIVLTGGGALLRHLPQLVKFKTGLDVRVGYPNENLAAGVAEEVNQPMYSTSIGLLLKGLENRARVPQKGAAKEQEAKESGEPSKEQAKNRFGILNNLKEKISNMFDENDSVME